MLATLPIIAVKYNEGNIRVKFADYSEYSLRCMSETNQLSAEELSAIAYAETVPNKWVMV